MSRPTVLLADDDRAICTVLSQAIRREGFNVVTTDDAEILLNWVEEGKGDLVITDVLMPKGNGLDFLPRIKSARPDLPVIVISANNTLMTAVKATELGAFEYFPKPFDLDALVGCVQTSLADRLGDDEAVAIEGTSSDDEHVLIGHSPAMQEVYKILARLVPVDLTVLLRGESGTGKELIARTLHTLSPRSKKPFIAVNMAAIPRDLIESELFGHEKGAFTGATNRKAGRFEQAEGGTLFLDEIGDMPLDAQTRLLRALQECEYMPVGSTQTHKTDIRIVCATHRDLSILVQEGAFREDLFFRLNVVPIYVPPLRERKEDIEALAVHCLANARKKGLPDKRLTTNAITALTEYAWPGNVRELENLIYRLTALSSEPALTEAIVRDALRPIATTALGANKKANSESLQDMIEVHLRQYFLAHKGDLPATGLYERVLDSMEKPLLKVMMEQVEGHQLRAAEILGINRNTLRKKLRERGIDLHHTGHKTGRR
ncbi:MAG: nitrogen regulation protein NR(I) [Alphaproteobacteria bacterium]|nr:nitrogen regulation protein NR(I) [Alphaproteobacteria bacterium]